MSPFFSIVIPTYNRAHTIRRPIDSIIAQTFIDWELIIVDDGSTDETKEIVLSYHDERIKYVWQENKKESAARNHGISLAKGEWICFQDSDDEYLTNHLDVLYNAILQYPGLKVIRSGILIFQNGIFTSKSSLKQVSRYDQYPFECFTTGAFHHTVLEKYKFEPKLFINEDLIFLLRIGLEYGIKVLPYWTGIYHCDPSSSGGIGINYERNLKNQKKCLDDILTWNKTLIVPYLVRKRCLNEILMLMGHLKYERNLIIKAIWDNIKIFKRFPLEYIKLITRILYVKIGEFSGLYRTQVRF